MKWEGESVRIRTVYKCVTVRGGVPGNPCSDGFKVAVIHYTAFGICTTASNAFTQTRVSIDASEQDFTVGPVVDISFSEGQAVVRDEQISPNNTPNISFISAAAFDPICALPIS